MFCLGIDTAGSMLLQTLRADRRRLDRQLTDVFSLTQVLLGTQNGLLSGREQQNRKTVEADHCHFLFFPWNTSTLAEKIGKTKVCINNCSIACARSHECQAGDTTNTSGGDLKAGSPCFQAK